MGDALEGRDTRFSAAEHPYNEVSCELAFGVTLPGKDFRPRARLRPKQVPGPDTTNRAIAGECPFFQGRASGLLAAR